MAIQKCYYCANPLNEEDMVIKPIPLKTKSGYRNYKRKFHIDCLPKYLKEHEDIKFREQENSDWDQVYQYFKSEILNLPAGANLSKYCVERLLGCPKWASECIKPLTPTGQVVDKGQPPVPGSQPPAEIWQRS